MYFVGQYVNIALLKFDKDACIFIVGRARGPSFVKQGGHSLFSSFFYILPIIMIYY